MAKHKGVYGKDWWSCDYCKLYSAIMQNSSAVKTPLPCKVCDKHDLPGAEPELPELNLQKGGRYDKDLERSNQKSQEEGIS